MNNAYEKYVFGTRNERVRLDVLKRLKPNRVRERTYTGMPDDGKTPFLDVFERMPDEPYIICLAHAIVESWLVSEPQIFEGEYFIGFPRPVRPIWEHFSEGISGSDDTEIDERRARLYPISMNIVKVMKKIGGNASE